MGDTNQVLHYVRTCATVCKNDRSPPLCPPSFCADRECQYCETGAYNDPVVDELASRRITSSPTPSPTASPVFVNPSLCRRNGQKSLSILIDTIKEKFLY